MKMVQDIIIRPIITEASMDRLGDKKYTFEVRRDATKPEIAKAPTPCPINILSTIL